MRPGKGFLEQYVAPIGGGAALFVVVAVALLVPYVVVQYRRRGRVGVRRTFVEALFLLYLICAWALVLLPLPDLTGEFCQTHRVTPQLSAFQWVHDTWRQWQRAGGEPMDLLRSQALWVRIFNVALLVPLGVFLRRWWRRGFWFTTAAGLLMSLAFEVSQLTGTWWLYPCPYRTFDVDDLMANTLGAAIGWIVAPLIFVLPSRRESDDTAHPDDRPTIPRRLVADAIDLSLVLLLAWPLERVLDLLPGLRHVVWGETTAGGVISDALGLVLVMVAVPLMAAHTTPGKALVRLRIAGVTDSPPRWWRVLVRAAVLWLPLIVPLWLLDAINTQTADESAGVALLGIVLSVPVLWVTVVIVVVAARADDRGPHDLVAGTAVITSAPRVSRDHGVAEHPEVG